MPSFQEQPLVVSITSAADASGVHVIKAPECVPADAQPRVKWAFWCRDSTNAPKRLPGEIILGFVPQNMIAASSFAAATNVWPLYESDGATDGGIAWGMDDGESGQGVEAIRDGSYSGGIPRWRNLFYSVQGTALAAGDRASLTIAIEWEWEGSQ